MIMLSDFYNDGYSIIIFTNSTAHVQRKETGIQSRLAPMWQQSGTLLFCSCHGTLCVLDILDESIFENSYIS